MMGQAPASPTWHDIHVGLDLLLFMSTFIAQPTYIIIYFHGLQVALFLSLYSQKNGTYVPKRCLVPMNLLSALLNPLFVTLAAAPR